MINCLNGKVIINLGIKGVTSEFKIKPRKEEFETPNYW